MKKYVYVMLFAIILMICSSIRVAAQTNPSGNPNTSTTNTEDRPMNYNYLGLLGLLGLYGLHKKRTGDARTVIDRKAS